VETAHVLAFLYLFLQVEGGEEDSEDGGVESVSSEGEEEGSRESEKQEEQVGGVTYTREGDACTAVPYSLSGLCHICSSRENAKQ
jgi:hypothetical protein